MKKERFLKVYSNLPTDEREQVVVVIEGQPYSWKAAYDEIKNDTETGKKILKKISELVNSE